MAYSGNSLRQAEVIYFQERKRLGFSEPLENLIAYHQESQFQLPARVDPDDVPRPETTQLLLYMHQYLHFQFHFYFIAKIFRKSIAHLATKNALSTTRMMFNHQ